MKLKTDLKTFFAFKRLILTWNCPLEKIITAKYYWSYFFYLLINHYLQNSTSWGKTEVKWVIVCLGFAWSDSHISPRRNSQVIQCYNMSVEMKYTALICILKFYLRLVEGPPDGLSQSWYGKLEYASHRFQAGKFHQITTGNLKKISRYFILQLYCWMKCQNYEIIWYLELLCIRSTKYKV